MSHVGRFHSILSVGVVGINYKTADLHLRETIARGTESFAGERGIFFRHPNVLLSTCNRTEIYFSAADLAGAHSDVLALMRSQIQEPFEHRLYSYFGIDCFAHLCKVAAGLDSAILAETEIQRQVKVAYGRSSELFSLPSSLHFIFQKGLKIGKTIRNELELERGSPTLYGTLWQMAQQQFEVKNILLVGNSEINRGFSSFLIRKGIRGFTLCTKYPAAFHLEEIFVSDRSILQRWQEYDLIVCAARAENYLIAGESPRRHLIFDLSVPRNVDPKVGLSPSIALWNIEQVNAKIEQTRKAQTDCLEKCYSLIWEQAILQARIYRQKNERAVKIQHGLEIGGRGSHPGCFPFP